MKYVLLALCLASAFGLCFLADRLIARVRRMAQMRRQVRLGLRYPIGACLLLAGAAIAVLVWRALGNGLLWAAAALFVCLAIYLFACYARVRITYTPEGFTFRHGRSLHFTFDQITGQRVAIGPRSVCLVLCAGGLDLVLTDRMQGLLPFLSTAYAGWCRQKGLDPASQSWHDPDAWQWFPDDDSAQEDEHAHTQSGDRAAGTDPV